MTETMESISTDINGMLETAGACIRVVPREGAPASKFAVEIRDSLRHLYSGKLETKEPTP